MQNIHIKCHLYHVYCLYTASADLEEFTPPRPDSHVEETTLQQYQYDDGGYFLLPDETSGDEDGWQEVGKKKPKKDLSEYKKVPDDIVNYFSANCKPNPNEK